MAICMTDQDDQMLVERVNAGDTGAYGLLFEKHRGKLLQMVMAIVHDRAEAEDVVQEAFIKAYRALHGFRGDAAFFTWLACIGINTAKGAVSGRRRVLTSGADALDAGEAEDATLTDERMDHVTPEDVCACGQMVAIVDAAFDTMNADQRTAISLHEFDGLSYQEIAEAMGSPIGTVRSRISDARITIARELELASMVRTDRLAAYTLTS